MATIGTNPPPALLRPITSRADIPDALATIPRLIKQEANAAASMAAFGGAGINRSSLVARLLERHPVEQLTAATHATIDGSIAVAPELTALGQPLRDAADSMLALVREAATDRSPAGSPFEVMTSFAKAIDAATTPFDDAARLVAR